MRRAAALLVLPMLVPACAGDGGEQPVRVAFVQDLSAPDADEHAKPALQAVELALARGAPDVELEVVDLAEDPDAVEALASDPAVVATIVAPGADGSKLAEAGIPTLSISTAGAAPAEGPWRRFVARMTFLADAIAAEAGTDATCVLSEDPPPDGLAVLVSERVVGAASAALPPDEAAALARDEGCDTVAWVGSPDPGVEVARRLPNARMVGGDRILDPDFRDDVGPVGEGAVAACACVDASTSLEPTVLRFIQDYQSEFGTAPGAYAVEAWDAVQTVVPGLIAGAGRARIAGALTSLRTFEGLVSSYGFSQVGELADPAGAVQLLELRSGRWVGR